MTSPLVWIGMGILIALVAGGVGYVLLQADLTAPAPDGSVGQSPFLYLGLLALLGVMGVGLARVYNARHPERHFALGTFLNVSIAGILVGGVIHELVHVILLQHATQFRVHFGDVRAVFSTCCLSPGELPLEELAYGIQFLVTIAWLIVFRHAYITSAPASAHSSVANEPAAHEKAQGKGHAKKTKETHAEHGAPKPKKSAEEEMDSEWESQKRVMEHYLNPKNEHPHHVSQRSHEEKELADLDKLRVKR